MNSNKSIFKKVIIIAVILYIVFGTTYFFFDNKVIRDTNYPLPTEYFYVNDYSRVLNEKTERYIIEETRKLEKKTKAQVVVVTVPNTQNKTLFEFSVELANRWGIGDKELDNGVLIFFNTDPDDPHVRLNIGKGLEGAIPDGKAGRILDEYAVEAKDNALWNTAAGDTFVAVLDELYAEYGIPCPDSLAFQDWEDGGAPTDGTLADDVFPEIIERENDASFFQQVIEAFFTLLAVSVIILIIIIIILLGLFFSISGSTSGRSGGGGGSFGGGGASR